MEISRRKFILAAPIVAGAVLQFSGVAAGQSAAPMRPVAVADRLSRLSWDSFYPFIHTDFTFGQGGNAVSLKLVSMTDTKPAGFSGGPGHECFVMRFLGPFDRPLKEGTYRVNHFNLGDFDLFITDGGRVKREQYYTAVINRITR